MATISKVATLVAGVHFVALASPSTAFAQATPEPAATPLTARMPAASPTADEVWVHLEGSDVAELQQDQLGDHRHWVTVCSAPCDRPVPSSFSYRISGEGIRNSRLFSLRAQSANRETILVDEGSKSGFVLGIVGASLGLVVSLVGFVVLLVGLAEKDLDTNSTSRQSGDSVEELGGALTIVGVAGIVGGTVAIVMNARTRVDQGTVSSPAARLPLPGLTSPSDSNSAFKNAFRDARHEAAGWAGPIPPMIGVPIFGGHF